MKVIIKATGEYVEVSRIQAVAGNNLYKDVNSGITYHPEELESIEQIRIQAAIAAMPIVADEDYSVRNEQHLIAKYAVQLADALIAELKKGWQDESND